MNMKIKQLTYYLEKDYIPHIDISDITQHTGKNLETQQLSRALAAMCLTVNTQLPAKEASECVTDGSRDKGIDAIAYSPLSKTMVIVQSKLKETVPSPTEVLKFTDGIRALLDNDYSYMNKKLKNREDELQAQFAEADHIRAVFTYLSGDAPSDEAISISDKLVQDLDDDNPGFLEFHYMNLDENHENRNMARDLENPEVELLLNHWLTPSDIRTELMGIVSGEEIAELYIKYGEALFDKNIRKVLKTTESNTQLEDTIRNNPEDFWAYNNGITILTDKIACDRPRPRKAVYFKLSSINIVNGAQTSGALARVYKDMKAKEEPSTLHQVQVTVRIISTEQQAENFGQNVTRFTNTQNPIGNREFVALDENQEKWHQSLKEEGHLYIYKSGGNQHNEGNGIKFTLEDATRALACLSGIDDATRTKSKISQMWANIESERYKRLFPDNLNACTMLNAVKFWREFDSVYSTLLDCDDRKRRKVLQEATYLCCTLLLEQFKWSHDLTQLELDPSTWLENQYPLLAELADACFEHHEELNASGYPGSFFKNTDKVSNLADTLREEVLHQRR